MPKFETKRILGLALILGVIFGLSNLSVATNDYSSSNFTVKAPVIDTGFGSSASSNFGLGQSLSQTAIGKSSSANFQLWSGFQYFFLVNSNTLTATAGNGQVSLSWTVPQTFLGISVSNYEVGTGTTSGSYVFESVGNVTSFTKAGLTNGTPYFFIIKAESAGGLFLVFSNQATATPNGATTPPGGGGGGGGGYSTSLKVSGTAYPAASIVLLQGATIAGTTVADSAGKFSMTLSNFAPGAYNFVLYATDINGNKSSNLSFSDTIASNIAVTESNLLVSPTITSDYSIVSKGDLLTLSGFAAPNSAVTVKIDSITAHLTFLAHSDGSGKYSYSLDTGKIDRGDYQARAAETFNSQLSPDSLLIDFTVGDRTVARQIQKCSSRSDLNCDGRVDLIDFSILLYYWDNPTANFSNNPRVDINHDGAVGLADFSIMLYDWTG